MKEQNLKNKEAYVKRQKNGLKEYKKVYSKLQVKIVLGEKKLAAIKR
jgi:hypothetical protein